MSHLPEAMQRMADADPSVRRIRRIPIGNHVVYHGRNGSMRQGRISFPALVLKQHEDDGSLDLIVEYEAEDRIWEQRVLPRRSEQDGHCWTLVEPIDSDAEWGKEDDLDEMRTLIQTLRDQTFERIEQQKERIINLDKAMYGNYNPPKKSMIEYLADFDERLKKLEKSLKA